MTISIKKRPLYSDQLQFRAVGVRNARKLPGAHTLPILWCLFQSPFHNSSHAVRAESCHQQPPASLNTLDTLHQFVFIHGLFIFMIDFE